VRLKELEKYNPITIQCHDNPDADTIASGYALYKYFKSKGNTVRLVYSGRATVQKSNLVLMLKEFNIPLEYISPEAWPDELNDTSIVYKNNNENKVLISKEDDEWRKGLLITVDCQYGAGNVSTIFADNVAIIDHHQVEITNVEMSIIRSDLGSCSTLVWNMLKEENFDYESDDNLCTALYFGLYTDTNQFSELFNPLDRDMMDQLPHSASLINTLRNSNISIRELEIAGVAMLRYSFNEEYGFAVIKSQPCDANVLGLISDFLIQVDKIRTCIVFNEVNEGYKLSVRSCVKEVNASELVQYVTEAIGSGGGHYEKAGGFISENLYRKKYHALHAEAYINARMTEYFDTYEVIHAKDYEADLHAMRLYQKNNLPIGFVKVKDMLQIGTPVTVRTLEGDIDLVVSDDLYLMIGIKGEVYTNREEKFLRSYEVLDKKYVYDECVIDNTYIPTIKNRMTGENILATEYAGVCVPTGKVQIYAKKLTKGVKIFTAWDKNKYMLGQPGDFIAVRTDDLHDVYIIEKKIFEMSYSPVK